MQAQNSAERKKSEKGRQYPAPPTRSKAGRLGIAKEFIDLLLDHDVSPSLGPSSHSHKRSSAPLATASAPGVSALQDRAKIMLISRELILWDYDSHRSVLSSPKPSEC